MAPSPSILCTPWMALTPGSSVQGRGFCSLNTQLPGLPALVSALPSRIPQSASAPSSPPQLFRDSGGTQAHPQKDPASFPHVLPLQLSCL